MWNNVINAWWPLVFYPATDAPRFTKGMWAMIGTAIVTLGVTALVYFLEKREQSQRRARRSRKEAEEVVGDEKSQRGSEHRSEKEYES